MARAALLAALAALCLAAPAAARAPLEIGVQDDPVFTREPSHYGGTAVGRMVPRYVGFRAAKRLRARVLKINLQWKHVIDAPPDAGGVYDWTWYDRAVDAARAQRMIPQVSLMGDAPGFATADGQPGYNAPDPGHYARFAADAVRHFRGRVRRWAIWNEPNWSTSLAPAERAAEIYRSLYTAGYAAIKGADPNAFVLFGELAPMGKPEAAIPPLEFLRDATCRRRDLRPARACDGLIADGFSHHPYTLRWAPEFPGPSGDDVTTGSLGRLSRVLATLARRGALATPGGKGLPLYLSEYGFHANSRTVLEPQRSLFSIRGFEAALRHPRVRQIVWYQLFAPPPNGRRQWDTGLFELDGTARPAYSALVRWARRAERGRRLLLPSR
ncbi:MAG: hypothetical protein M3340_05120 [Actinomycetota bacterium]|nr:hypothetical protein [Actinomycetota bacterium]